MGTQSFAQMLYRRHLEGESVEELAAGLEIPVERIQQRIRVAAMLNERLYGQSAGIPTSVEVE